MEITATHVLLPTAILTQNVCNHPQFILVSLIKIYIYKLILITIINTSLGQPPATLRLSSSSNVSSNNSPSKHNSAHEVEDFDLLLKKHTATRKKLESSPSQSSLPSANHSNNGILPLSLNDTNQISSQSPFQPISTSASSHRVSPPNFKQVSTSNIANNDISNNSAQINAQVDSIHQQGRTKQGSKNRVQLPTTVQTTSANVTMGDDDIFNYEVRITDFFNGYTDMDLDPAPSGVVNTFSVDILNN